MKVLGVDPGLVRTGWAVVESRDGRYELLKTGLIAPRSRSELGERLAEGFERFNAVLEELEPDVMVIEDLFSEPRHPRSALLMAHMRGVLCLAAGQRGLRIEPMTATTVKQRLTGNGHASKAQVARMVLSLCDAAQAKVRADMTDAIALAVAGLHHFERGSALTTDDQALLTVGRRSSIVGRRQP